MQSDKKIISYAKLQPLRKKLKKEGKTIVLTTGCFDILHLGHVIHFNFCRTKGDVLVVSVGNDKTVKRLKGPNRPINDEKFRARMVAALECVDYVVISREIGIMDHTKIVELLKSDVYVVPQTDSMLEEKRRLILKHKGKFITCRRHPPGNLKGGISTTLIEGKLK
jgi:rfaE bifunctional protein nucleotidyltransferase chain/domain